MFWSTRGGASCSLRASLVGLLLCAGPSAPVGAQAVADVVPPAEYLARYRIALRSLAHTYVDANVQIDCVEIRRALRRAPGDNELHAVEFIRQLSYAYCDGKQRLHVRRDQPPVFSDRVIVQNGGQDFAVSRPAAGAPYSIVRFAEGKEGPRALDNWWLGVRSAPCFIPRLEAYHDVPAYPAMVESPEFTFEEVRPAGEPEGPGLKAFFKYSPRKEKVARVKGWVVLDPALGWVIRAYDFQVEVFAPREQRWELDKFSRSVSYQSNDGSAVPTRISTKVNRGGAPEGSLEYQISRFAFGCAPASEFTLAGYGLGDLAKPGK